MIHRPADLFNLAGGFSMSRLVMHFLKDVTGDNGHETEICQSTIEVDAVSKTKPPNWQNKSSAKPRIFSAGRFGLIGSRSSRRIFRPDRRRSRPPLPMCR
jgi:hypothetical protein